MKWSQNIYFDLKKAEKAQNTRVWAGLKVALDNIDDVVETNQRSARCTRCKVSVDGKVLPYGNPITIYSRDEIAR